MSYDPQPPGWYHADGDPPDTVRYWDGTIWQGGPTPRPATSMPGTPAAPAPGPFGYPESSNATAALVLSILGLVACGILGPFGWSMANKELAGIDAGRRDPNNRGVAQTAKVIGIIATVFLALAFAFIIFFLVAAAASST